MLRTLQRQNEDVRPENFAKIFDDRSILYITKVLDLENKFNDLAKLRATDQSRVMSSAMGQSSFMNNSMLREKDPVRKQIESKISSLVKSVITQASTKRKVPRTAGQGSKNKKSESGVGDGSEQPGSGENSEVDEEQEDFLDEQKLGFKIEKAEQELEMHGSELNEPAGSDMSMVTRNLFDITATLADMQKVEQERVLNIANSKQMTPQLVNDMMVLFSCLFGKSLAKTVLEVWLNKRTGDIFNAAAGERAERRKDGIEIEVENMKRLFREFFVKLD